VSKISDVVNFDATLNLNKKYSDTLCHEEDGRWDPGTVIGIKKSDVILVVGNPAWMPWVPKNVVSTKNKVNEIVGLIADGHLFDKIIIGKEVQYTNELSELLGNLLVPGGFVVFFPKDSGAEWQFVSSVEFHHPEVTLRNNESLHGRIIMASFNGSSWRKFYN
jgi:hypothetical protein